MLPRPPTSTLFPYTTLFRSVVSLMMSSTSGKPSGRPGCGTTRRPDKSARKRSATRGSGSKTCTDRSEEHTSELQSPYDLVCRLLLEKKKKKEKKDIYSIIKT